MYGHGYGYGMGFFWWIGPLLFIIFLVALMALLFRRGGMHRAHCPVCGQHSHHDEPVSAKEILERRYARGEIGRDEYLKIKEDLEAK